MLFAFLHACNGLQNGVTQKIEMIVSLQIYENGMLIHERFLEWSRRSFARSVSRLITCSYNMSAMAIRKAARLLILFYPLSLTL